MLSEDLRDMLKSLDVISTEMASLRMCEPWWQLLSGENRRQWQEFAAVVVAYRRSLTESVSGMGSGSFDPTP